MTRGGGSGSRRGRGSRDPGAARRGWAPLAPPCEAPTRPETCPPRRSRARLRRVAAAAAAAMSPGKPGAGGAGTRRTGGRRRRRRRRLEAVTQAPGLGRTAGPGSRVPGTFQGARGMKPAAREARPPPRSPGLRWALPPLLLLLRLGQILCADDCGTGCNSTTLSSIARESPWTPAWEDLVTTTGAASNGQLTLADSRTSSPLGPDSSPMKAVTISPTSVTPTWKNNTTASNSMGGVKSMNENQQMSFANQTGDNSTDSSPGSNGTSGDTTVGPGPVTDLLAAFVGVTHVVLTWKKDNITVTCRMLLEGSQESTENLMVNISDLKPGSQYMVTVYPLGSNETENGLDAGNTDSLLQPPRGPTAPGYKYRLKPAASSSDPSLAQDAVEVLLLRLKPDTRYTATVYPRALNGAEGQPRAVEFKTNSSQVFDMKVVNISATSLTLTWKINDNESSSVYTYKIQVVGETISFNFTVQETHAVITALSSSTLYNITVYPFLDDGSEGTPGFIQVYTPPSPVSDFRVTSVSTREIGLAWKSNDSHSFEILITPHEAGESQTVTTAEQSIVIGDLYPGTIYRFDIYPLGPNGIKGDFQTVFNRTDPSAVFDIRVVNVTTTEMQLEWQNADNASGYIYSVEIQSKHGSRLENSSHRGIALHGLTPGTLYKIIVTPKMNSVQGIADSIVQYTRPSTVSSIEINTNTTAAALNWQNIDKASSNYTYHLLIGQDGSSSKATQIVTDIGVTHATVTNLIPGTSYTVEILTQVENVNSSAPGRQSFCTDPEPVASFHCEAVPKKATLVFRWACPLGTNTGFELEISHGYWKNTTILGGCSSKNGSEFRTEVTHLNFSTLYDVSIATWSCNKKAPPAQNTCLSGITDPPLPDGSPNITSVSHNSVKVKFSGFEASHGPIQAYALVLTTVDAVPSADILRYTYDDFKRGASDTYVTYLITTGEKRRAQGLSEVLKYEVDVGNESITHGYYNGKLEPLGSYRACVAGFTSIAFMSRSKKLIDGNESYVSFSPCSEAVFLPQDPGVICGAVFGCIFGALVIVAVGGFIFWRKKRKDAKNNDVNFSQIKPKKSKLIKVENFEAYFKKQQADSNCGFAEEYEDLKLVGINLPKYAAELVDNRGKNRYNNVLPYDTSRVKLSVQTHSTDDYINANYLPGYHSKEDFIATQGPLPNTLKDFWRMVWEKNVYAIVMLTKCVEQGRTKCEEYWPSKQAQDYGDITVAMTSEIVLPEWTIRDFTVKYTLTSESHPLRQFHFTSWPDHGVPDTTDLLINFRYLVRDYMKQSPPESPILVHCSAGVGRTGTFVAIDRLIYQIENENTVDVYGIVYDLRMHRPLMVQTEDQYIFLNQCVLDIIRSQKDSKVDLIYQNTTAMTIYENLAPMTTFGKTNGYIA
ncbi:receptor-type tyrosine-protein phosphatase eta [Cervus elaphus]|uniref:receptor-type tyrosine-protein phosphatase eta n=1 Tax=Cervus elaphus TaxID=9860 RepID=UPI001CC2A301|nr:receptor-type tyrosine-protein phosphatase eta [Cervus elaphus]